MTILEIILIATIWLSYGVFNAWQHDWHEDEEGEFLLVLFNIVLAPVALTIRIIRGTFYWKGKY